MSGRSSALISLLGAACLFPLRAQDQELQMLNFNVGGGLSVPLNPTGRYLGVNGNAGSGMGANFDKHNSIEGDFMWSGLSPSLSLVHPIGTPTGSVNLFTVTGNYRFHIDSLADSAFGIYLIAGGGWYYRHTSIDKNYVVPPITVCQPIYNWWGFACGSSGYVVQSVTIASHGTSAGGLNAGVGFTIRLPSPGWKFFVESRYNYAWSNFIPTTLVPVTFGFRFN
jgi:hypothetical protein